MAIQYYTSAGDGTAPTAAWSTGHATLAAALAAAAALDSVYIDMANIASADAEVSGTTTWTIPDNVTVVIGTQNGASGITVGQMGTTYWIGNSTTGRTIAFNPAGQCRVIGGLTLRTLASATTFNGADGGAVDIDNLRLWSTHTGSNPTFRAGNGAGNSRTIIRELILDCDRSTTAVMLLALSGLVDIFSITSEYAAGSLASAPVFSENVGVHGMGVIRIWGGDLSAAASGQVLVGNNTRGAHQWLFQNVVLPTSYVRMDTQTLTSEASTAVTITNCQNGSGGAVVSYEYENALGALSLDTGIYLTAGPAAASWKLVTTAACTANQPFYTPWFREYKAAATGVEPTAEVLRDGSATAFTDAELWQETLTLETSGSVESTQRSTRVVGVASASNVPTGAGAGAWTGESGTLWSGELTVGSLDLEEDGYVMRRYGFAAPSSTVYCDIPAIA